MRVRDQVITAQGVLSLVAITAMLGYAAYALQLAPQESIAAYAQDRQVAVVPQPTDLNPARSAVYSGTIVTHGSGFVLRQPSGAVYHLDDPTQAQRFAGKPVKVTGKLDQAGILLHIEKIEEVRA
jgi:hypothetical protein